MSSYTVRHTQLDGAGPSVRYQRRVDIDPHPLAPNLAANRQSISPFPHARSRMREPEPSRQISPTSISRSGVSGFMIRCVDSEILWYWWTSIIPRR
jgi:hypothetical protein